MEKLSSIVSGLVGDFDQTPPLYSAIKYKGKPLYLYARKGEEVSLGSRRVKIYNIEILSVQGDEIVLRISCGSGTYIRSIAYEIGKRYGCGAIVDELKRIRIGDFRIEDSIELDKLSNLKEVDKNRTCFIKMEKILKDKS